MTTLREQNNTTIENIQENPPALFRNMPKKDLGDLLQSAVQRKVEAFEELLPGFPDGNGHGFLVLEGIVEARKNGTIIEQFSAGDFIGEAFLHSKAQLSCDLTATVPAVVLIFNRGDVVQFFRTRPEKLLKIYTMNVIEAQHKHIIGLYKRIVSGDTQLQVSL
ncbi:Cyclic nucleotide-binding domain-containing protein [Cyclonatronum proteinivorum]|uniref:Cyclic nucleotide-binding domain-containing protein n=1 Tax=Cyclonatronum proteinivorum TaxID=1457365 RepID=A0A345UH20_9BACT|nr:cyclic nucleotide-binding domain-containing protein [Cyclonatronum proteinivorum]AXI99771.1 Cyclic nucleotide-binding domain-containing protein [Cyclonatronum proteinivorum]